MSNTAKLFKNGESQAIRLHKEFHMSGREVCLIRQGYGIRVEPVEEDTSSLGQSRPSR